MAELTTMRNIGKEIERKLKSINISTAEELRDIGSKEAFYMLKMQYPNVCLVHLYTLEGAILDIDYNQLSEDVKQSLKQYSDSLNES